MGLGKSKPKKPDPASASGRSSTAWGDANGNSRGRNNQNSNPRVARPNLQQFKSSSAGNGVRNGASNSNNRSGHNNNNNWADQSNTSYNLLDGTVSHATDDFRTVQINHDRRRLSGGGGGGSDKFTNFRGMMDYRKEDGYGQRRNEAVAPVHASKNSNPASRNSRVQGPNSLGKINLGFGMKIWRNLF